MGLIIFGIFIGLLASIGYFGAYTAYEKDKERDDRRWGNGKYVAKKPVKSFAVILFMAPVILFAALASTVSVGTGQIAVMTRFGRVTGQELGEGFHVKSPLDQAHKYDIKVQKEEATAAAASKDLQDVNSTLVINYSIEAGKVSEIHRTVGELYREKLILPAIQETFKASTSKYDATQLVTDRSSIKADAQKALEERLKKYGIVINDISITNFTFSPEFTKAIEAKQVAQQQAQQAGFLKEKAVQEAAAEIERARGSAESQRLQQQTLTPLLIQKQAIEKWSGNLPTTVTGDMSTILSIPIK